MKRLGPMSFFLLIFGAIPSVYAEVEFICPCSFQSVGSTAADVTAGIRNNGDNVSGDLRITVYANDDSEQGAGWSTISYVYAPERLEPGSVYAEGTTFRRGFVAPPTADYEVLFSLEESVNEEWVFQDEVRLEPRVQLDTLGGSSSGDFSEGLRGHVYFSGKPEVEVIGDQVTITIPPIWNKSPTASTGPLEILLAQKAGPEYFSQRYYEAAHSDLGFSIAPNASSEATTLTLPFVTRSVAGYDYFHLALRDATLTYPVLAWSTVKTLGDIPIITREFEIWSVDTLADSDFDGVSDFNENLMSTDPNNPENFPGSSTLDVMVLYTPEVSDLYLGEPTTRIIHELEFGNQVFSASGIKASLRLVHLEEVTYAPDVTNQIAIDAVQAQEGPFVGLDSRREAAGADLVVLFRVKNEDATNNCGRGALSRVGREGDFARQDRSQNVSVVFIDCKDTTTIHEFGHNSGLAHSYRDEDSFRGTFLWSRGHGADGGSCTVMSSWQRFPGCDYYNVFSSPDLMCPGGLPCGIERSDRGYGADAVLSWNTVRFQLANLSPDPPDVDGDGLIDFEDSDDDGDGVPDINDAYPLVSLSGNTDTDGDGRPDECNVACLGDGMLADDDDDNDGVADVDDAFPLDPTRSVVAPNGAPMINIEGAATLTLNIGQSFSDPGALAFDDEDGDLTGSVVTISDVNTAVPGTYIVEYRVTDSGELTSAVTRSVIVIQPLSSGAVRIAAGQVIELPVVGTSLIAPTGAERVVPNSATAASINVTAVTPGASGFITVWPCGVARPLASNLNYVAGDVVPNGVIAPIGGNGKVCFFSLADTDLVVDVAGWFEGDAFVGATPLRLVDTRETARVTPAAPLVLKVADIPANTADGTALVIPANVGAVALNVTVVNPDAPGFVTVYPCDVPRPLASNVNYTAGQIVPNGVIAPVSAGGEVCIYSLAPSDVVVDLAGWFPGAAFTAATPKRLVDTRDGTGGQLGKLTPAGQLSVAIQGEMVTIAGSSAPIPPAATAAALNVTIVNPDGSGFATVWPCSAAKPLASNLNFAAGQVVANNVIAPIGEQGNVCFYANVPSDIIVDIAGYFSGETGNQFLGSTPKRYVDTRANLGPAPQ